MSFTILGDGLSSFASERLTFFLARESDRFALLEIHRENFKDDYIKNAWGLHPDEVTESMCDRFIYKKIYLNELFCEGDQSKFKSLFFGIREKQTNKLIGALEVYQTDAEVCEIGVFVSAEFKNNGYATEITKSFIELAKKSTDIESIVFSVKMNNVASLRVAEKCGFEKNRLYTLYPGCDVKEFFLCINDKTPWITEIFDTYINKTTAKTLGHTE